MLREFQSIVIVNGVNLVSIRDQSLYDALVHWFGVFDLVKTVYLVLRSIWVVTRP